MDRPSSSTSGQPQTRRPTTNDNNWLVDLIVFFLRSFVISFVSFCRAVVIVADSENIFELTPIQTHPVNNPPISPPTSPPRPKSSGKFTRYGPSPAEDLGSQAPVTHGRYVVFVGRDVGYTESRQVKI